MKIPGLLAPSSLALFLALAVLVGCDGAGPEVGPPGAVRVDGPGASGENSRGLWQINIPPQRVDLRGVGPSSFSAALRGTDGGTAHGQLLLRHRAGVRRHRVEEARVECDGGRAAAVVLRGTATEAGRGGGPTTLTFEVRVAPTGPVIDVIYSAAGNSADGIYVEGDVRFGLTACGDR